MGCSNSTPVAHTDATKTTEASAVTAIRAPGTAKILVVFYSMYGHNLQMAKAAAEGAAAAGATVDLRRIPETLPEEVLAKMHAVEAQKAFADVPLVVVSELGQYDGIVFLSPTRFGGVPAQVQTVLDQTGQLWMTGALNGKPVATIVSTATQHGGQETTHRALQTMLMHHGMIIVPLFGYNSSGIEELKGNSPYGASTITGGMGERMPSEVELGAARHQGKTLAEVAAKLAAK